jgi:tetratricopeptide (TPR) repeat protein
MRRRTLLLAVVLLAASAQAAPKEPEPIVVPTAEQIAELERARDKRPKSPERRNELALAHYRFARAALDRGEFPVYEDHLARAMKEWVESLRLEPESPEPHIYMGMVSAYQGRIDDTLDSMYNARSLAPGAAVMYSNIAETLIYAGRDAREVESWLSRAERLGSNPAIIDLNRCLLQWRDGNLDGAARSFRFARKLDPSVVEVWNEAPVSTPIKTFADLTAYCCGSPACGPYLERACQKSELEVAHREVPEETALRELRIEMERRRELDRIYKKRQDLEVRVKKPEQEGAAGATTPPPSSTPENAPEEQP